MKHGEYMNNLIQLICITGIVLGTLIITLGISLIQYAERLLY